MSEETNLSGLEPNVQTVPNDDTPNTQPQQSEVDKRMSEMLGFKVESGIEENNQPASQNEPAPTGGEEGQEENPPAGSEGNEPPAQTGEKLEWWGAPNANGNYEVSFDKIKELEGRVKGAFDSAARQNYATQQKIKEQQQRIAELVAREREYRNTQTQSSQPTATPQPSPLEKAKAKMVERLSQYMSEEDARDFTDSQFEAVEAALADRKDPRFEKLQPLISRWEEKAYTEDVENIANGWTNKIAQNLGSFNVAPEECASQVRSYIGTFMSAYKDRTGRWPTKEEIEKAVALDSSTLSSYALNRHVQSTVAKYAQQKGQTKPQTPPATQPQANTPPAAKRDTESSTSAAQKRVTSGENLRMANDAGLMGTPSSGSNPPNNDFAKMAKLLSEQNGGGSFTF